MDTSKDIRKELNEILNKFGEYYASDNDPHYRPEKDSIDSILQVFKEYIESKRQKLRTPDGNIMQSETASIKSLLEGLEKENV